MVGREKFIIHPLSRRHGNFNKLGRIGVQVANDIYIYIEGESGENRFTSSAFVCLTDNV